MYFVEFKNSSLCCREAGLTARKTRRVSNVERTRDYHWVGGSEGPRQGADETQPPAATLAPCVRLSGGIFPVKARGKITGPFSLGLKLTRRID